MPDTGIVVDTGLLPVAVGQVVAAPAGDSNDVVVTIAAPVRPRAETPAISGPPAVASRR